MKSRLAINQRLRKYLIQKSKLTRLADQWKIRKLNALVRELEWVLEK